MREEGYIDEVSVIRLGTFLVSSASVDSTALLVEDASDFDDVGGICSVNETVIEYVTVDYEQNVLYLADPLVEAVEAEDQVLVEPAAYVKQAAVIINEDDEPITALINHALFNRIPEGIRQDENEAVSLELVGDTWYIVDILGQAPTQIGTDELDEEFVADTQTAMEKALEAIAEAELAMNWIETANHTFRQPNEPTSADRGGKPLASGDIWFDTDDDNKAYVYDGSAWVAVGANVAAELEAAVIQAQADAAQALTEAQNAFDEANAALAKADGSIKTYVAEYAVNSSETVAPTSGWSSTTPARSPGTFIWYRTKVTYHDGTTSLTNPALLTGNTGPQGPQGPQGSQGIPGPAGADGQTLYTWLKYADTPTTGMSDSPVGKTYMGLAYNKTSSTESSNYADYSWSLIKGADGVAGPPGADGQTTYTWVKYADNASGGGMSDSPTGKTYIGLAFNKTTATESTTATDYQWSLIQGPQGATGPTGATGVGISSVTPYFYVTTTGAAAPATPTASPPPAPWTTTEPNYTANTELWRTERVVYTNGTFSYTPVTKVSSYTAATTAMATANGKNKIIFSDSAASGTGYATGDVWFQRSGSLIIGQWEFVSGAWAQRTIDSATIANLNVGKLVGGDISAITVNINSNGVIKSNNYVTQSTGWRLNSTGLEMNSGTITGALIQSSPVANRGIKFNNAALMAYDSAGNPTFSMTASTGAISMRGELQSGSTISGATLSGTLQTSVEANRGIKIMNSGLYAYNSVGGLTFYLDSSSGYVTMLGNLTTNSIIDGATVTGGQIQTVSTANRGIKMTSTGLTAYDSNPASPTLGQAMLTISPNTGSIAMRGTLTSGSAITGAQVTGQLRTSSGYPRVEIIDQTTYWGHYPYGSGEIRFVTDATTVADPSRISGTGSSLTLTSATGYSGMTPGRLQISNSTGGRGYIRTVNSDLWVNGEMEADTFRVGTSSTIRAMTFGVETGYNTNGSGQFSIVHNIGSADHTLVITTWAGAGLTRVYKVISRGVNSDVVQMDNASGNAVANSGVGCQWIAMR